eukprot:7204-Heterococcus_DN1.PRE.2
MPFPVKDESQVITAANSVASDRITPVFAISNVTGHGLDLLRSFIVKLRRKRVNANELYAPDPSTLPSVLLNIDGVYQVPGVGLVIGGTLIRGSIHTGQNLQVGPDRSGQYQAVTVRSIECKRLPVKEVGTGVSATLAIRPLHKRPQTALRRQAFRKGMIAIDGTDKAQSCWEFEAEVVILHHSTTIGCGYQPVVHQGVIRQAASIISIDGSTTETLRTGQTASATFKFQYYAEFLTPGSTFLFREGLSKGVGRVKTVFYQ